METAGIECLDFNRTLAAPQISKFCEDSLLQNTLKSTRLEQHFHNQVSPFCNQKTISFQDMVEGPFQNEASGFYQHSDSGPAHLKAPINIGLQPAKTIQKSDSTQPEINNQCVDYFIKTLWPKAQKAALKLGLDPKILIAQAALETGWGKFIAKDDSGSSNNLFNIKKGNAKNCESLKVNTKEYINGHTINTLESFKKYTSLEQSLEDYVTLIKKDTRYQAALAHASDPKLYVLELHKAGYATDPLYSHKIFSIYYGSHLNQTISNL